MESKRREISHDYNLRSTARTRMTRLQSRIRHQGNVDASSSNSHQESSNQPSRNNTPHQNRRKRSQSQPRRSSNKRPRKSSSVSSSNNAADDIQCIICLDTVDERQMKRIPCGHSFHKKCCNNWLVVNDACPVCRTVVAPRRGNQDRNRERIIDNTPISDIIYFFTLSVFRDDTLI